METPPAFDSSFDPERTLGSFTASGQVPVAKITSPTSAPAGNASPAAGSPANASPATARRFALRGLTRAPLPVVVFSSLANLSVPDFSDRCRIVIAEEGLGGYLIERPMPTEGASWIGSGFGPRLVRCDEKSGQLITPNTVRTPFVGPMVRGELGYHGVVMHMWDGGDRPSAEDAAMARVAVAHAVALIHEQRLAAQIEDCDDDEARDGASSSSQHDRQQYRPASGPRLHLVHGDDDIGHTDIDDRDVDPHGE